MERIRDSIVDGVSSFWLGSESRINAFRGREFSLTQAQVREIYDRQGGKCYYTGDTIPLPGAIVFGEGKPSSVAIVCLETSGPVTEANSVLTTRRTRSLRSMFKTEQEFIDFCRKVSSD
jgi:hypothetical protein